MSGYSSSARRTPCVAVGVGRVADDAAHVPDAARATDVLEQPAGADVPVRLLVVGQVVGLRVGHVRVDGDGGDAGLLRLVEGRD